MSVMLIPYQEKYLPEVLSDNGPSRFGLPYQNKRGSIIPFIQGAFRFEDIHTKEWFDLFIM